MESELSGNDVFPNHNVTLRGTAILSDEGYISIGIYLVILGLTALAGNTIVLLVILCRKRTLQKLHNILLVNMATADLLVTLTAYPMTAVSSFYKRWLFGDLACQLGGFLVFMLTMVSMDTLTLIAVFRYILVCRPKYHHLLSQDTARPAVAVTWVHAVVWTALPLLGWNRYIPEAFKTSCTIDWDSSSFSDISYVLVTILTCYALHVCVVVFCYSCILSKSRKLTFGTSKNSNLIKLEEVLWHHKIETEREVTKMCAVMVVAFLVCWTPYAIISLLPAFGTALPASISTLPTMFAKLSCALNPIIYAFMSSKFREVLCTLRPWGQHVQNRIATTGIELAGESKLSTREPERVREYRGDMTNQGVYIGNMAVSLAVQSSVF